MSFHLTVIDPFNGYAKGDRIEDADTIEEILASESSDKVVKVPE